MKILNKISKLGNVDKRSLSFLWAYAQAYKRFLLIALVTALPLAATGGLMAWLLNRLVKHMSLSIDLKTILIWGSGIFLIILARGSLGVLNRYIMTKIHMNIAHDIRLDFFQKILQSPIAFHNASKTGHISNSFINDIKFASAGVIELFSAIWQYPVMILVLIGTMFYFNSVIALTVCILFPLLNRVVTKIGRLSRKAEFQYMENQAQLQGFVVESLINIRQVKYFTMLKKQLNELDEKGKSMIEARLQATLLRSSVSPISDIFSAVSICIMVLIAYKQIQAGSTSPEEIAGCLAAGVGLMSPIRAISNSFVMMQQCFAAVKRLHRIDSLCGDNTGTKAALPNKIRKIEFKGVDFSYDGRQTVYQNLNLKFQVGESIALAGKSGAGKSTLLNLISGFYPCTNGQILIEGIDLVSANIDSWFSKIGVVSQESLLFDDTILNNILHGNENASDKEVDLAIARSGCKEMINRFPKKLETMVGERGCYLSGGERKRVALARTLVRPISILILDEATSELDSETEKSILEDIRAMGKNMLVILISHHPEIFKYCTRALVLTKGRIQEMTPAEAYETFSG